MINVDDHTAHCRMPNAIKRMLINPFTTYVSGADYCRIRKVQENHDAGKVVTSTKLKYHKLNGVRVAIGMTGTGGLYSRPIVACIGSTTGLSAACFCCMSADLAYSNHARNPGVR